MEATDKKTPAARGSKRTIKRIGVAALVLIAALGILYAAKAANIGKAQGAELPEGFCDRYSNEAIAALNYAVHNAPEYYIDEGVLYAKTTDEQGTELDRGVLSVRVLGDKLLYLKHMRAANTNNLYCIDLEHMKTTLAAKNVGSYIVCGGEIIYAPYKGSGLYGIDAQGNNKKLTDLSCGLFWQYGGEIFVKTFIEADPAAIKAEPAPGGEEEPTGEFVLDLPRDAVYRLAREGDTYKPEPVTVIFGADDPISLSKLAMCSYAVDTENNALYLQRYERDGNGKVTYTLSRLDLNDPGAGEELLWSGVERFGFASNSIISSGALPEYITPSEKVSSLLASVYGSDTERTVDAWGSRPFIMQGLTVWNAPEKIRGLGRFYLDENGRFRYMSRFAVLTPQDLMEIGG